MGISKIHFNLTTTQDDVLLQLFYWFLFLILNVFLNR